MTPNHTLLLYKVSTYEHYQERPADFRPSTDEMDRFKETHETHYHALDFVEQRLKEKLLPYTKIERGRITDYHDYDFIITVGGDGTFLEAAHYVSRQGILGVNSDPLWSVGRLCSTTEDTFKSVLENILTDQSEPRLINRLKVATSDGQNEAHFLNDILVCHQNPASLSRYVLDIDGVSEEQRSSGLWISTAAGSTGAIHSAGGEALDFESKKMQYHPRELYRGWNGASYQLCGGVLDPGAEIKLCSLMAEGVIFVDGSHYRIPFQAPEHVTITQSDRPLQIF